jgi:acetylornithine deacetylase
MPHQLMTVILNSADILSQLVRIPSVNPMGRALNGPEFLESRLTDFLETLFSQLGLQCWRQTVHPGRDNIIARLEGDADMTVLMEVHQDTVPTDGMTIDSFAATRSDGRIYGRGACDVKGGMAAMLVALSQLAEQRPSAMPTIILACTVNEEHGFTGASALAETWSTAEGLEAFQRAPDLCIVAEPTELQVVVAHKGVVRWKCHALGRAGHSSQPELAENAIYKMADIVSALERYARHVAPTLGQHALCGHPTLSVGTIAGGLSVNTVPENCTIEIDRRLLPGEQPDAARQHAIDFLNAEGLAAEHEPAYLVAPGLSDENNRELAARLSSAANQFGANSNGIGVPYGTDAAAISATGVPSVVFGPGNIEQAHTADEWIELEQVELAAQILFEFCARSAVQ